MVPREFGKDDIFKYGSLSSLARTLDDETLGFSELSNYNDPFESEFSTFLHITDQISITAPQVLLRLKLYSTSDCPL